MREESGAFPHGAEHLVLIRLAELSCQLCDLLLGTNLETFQVCQHGADCFTKELLDLLFHEKGEVLEADGLHVARTELLVLHLPDILPTLVHAHLGEVARALGVIGPPWEGQGEPDEVVGEVTEALDPLGNIVAGQIPVVLVELVANEDRPLELRVNLAAPCQSCHGRRVACLLHAQHDVPPIHHEGGVELVDLARELLPCHVVGKVAEARKVNYLHVHTPGRLDADVHGFRAHSGAKLLVGIPHYLHDVLERMLGPLVRLAVANEPLRTGAAGHVPELEDGGSSAAQRAGAKVELLARQCLDETALAHGLLADEDELRHREIFNAKPVLHPRLDIAKQIEQLALGRSVSCRHLWSPRRRHAARRCGGAAAMGRTGRWH
mmetsp:Transcript_57486/g.129588  ORF Transcript_57486/g.129588 Transcript_57486/m.129588 type:complete len:379 (-) Transcript_57486:13-1149(-)